MAPLFISACTDNAVTTSPRLNEQDVFAVKHANGSGHSCAENFVVPVHIEAKGKAEDEAAIGTVSVNNVRERLLVSFRLNPGWTLSTTSALVVSRPAELPKRVKKGAARELAYYVRHADGTTSYDYSIMLSDVGSGPGNTLVVAARADVKGTSGKEKNKKATAWAGTATAKKKNDVRYVEYKVKTCSQPSNTGGGGSGGTGRGAVTVTFDDGWLTEFTRGYRIMKENGLVGNIAINGLPIQERHPDYVTLANVQEMSRNGWAVVNHSWSHVEITTLNTVEDIREEINRNRDWIRANGFRGDWIFVVPYHAWGPREVQTVREVSVAARGHSPQEFRTPQQFTPHTDFLQSWPPADKHKLVATEPLAPGVDIETAKRELTVYLDRARTQGKFVEVYFHAIPDEKLADFQAIVAILALNKDLILPYDKLISNTGAITIITR